jgi:hypothetical protein
MGSDERIRKSSAYTSKMKSEEPVSPANSQVPFSIEQGSE